MLTGTTEAGNRNGRKIQPGQSTVHCFWNFSTAGRAAIWGDGVMNNKISGDTASAFSVRKAIRIPGPTLAGVAIVFAVWYHGLQSRNLNVYVLPTPERYSAVLKNVAEQGNWQETSESVFACSGRAFAIAFVLAFCAWYVPGIIFRKLFGYYEHTVQFFRNVPPLSMIPLLILWCGIGETTKTVIIVLASFFPCI